MLIDCQTCSARGPACRDCVVTVFLAISTGPDETGRHVELDEAERDAVNALAAAGLVPPLRLVAPKSGQSRDIA